MLVVFDGSGSMWGKLEGERQTKFVNAREAVKTGLAKVKPETRIGLMSFGHRRAGDCSDVQTIIPPEAQTAEKINGVLEKLNPRGKGPLGAALKEAAKVLGKGPGRRSLLVIHDDADNCGIDPCSGLAEMQAAAPGLVVHVVGLGLKAEEAQRLQCLAKPTQGRFAEAQTAAQAASAIEDMLRLAALDASPPKPLPKAVAPAPVGVALPKAGERPPLAADGPPGLRLASLLVAGQAPLPRRLTFTIMPEARGPSPVLESVTAQDRIVPLAPGRYSIELRDGLLTQTKSVTVTAKGQIAVDFVLDAGLVRFPGAAPPADAFVTFIEAIPEAGQPDRAGRTLGVVPLSATQPALAIPPGRWTVRLDVGEARIERTVTLAAGQVIDLPAVIPFARLKVSLAGRDPASRQPAFVQIVEDDPDAPRGRREVARAATEPFEFVLPAGTYTVIARDGIVEARERLSLAAGETVSRTLALAGARVTLASRLVGGIPANDPVTFRIERIDVVPPETISAHQPTAQLALPAGRYRIEARHGLVNARASREIELAAGQQVALTLEQQAGVVQFVAAPGHQGELIWELLDTDGRLVWSTAQPDPRAVFQAGRYTVRAEGRGKKFERPLEVRAGQTTTVQMKE